ncbi:MAG: polyribonucleotide nucleotidyltransferase [Christensenellaceae bacterium]|jgi:polyribonucleotide nucleotidyltransferase|nr:polyribonucleotide nucleotidyltransferase [Christensenellaceae bacterium]
MDNYKKFETTIGGKKVVVEVGALCGLANGSCTVTCGETVVMANATISENPREGLDYFPLSVDFEEKMYAVGKIPGGFRKREGRAGDKAILTSRLIDRPLRPLFTKGIYNDVSMVVTTLSIDPDVDPAPFGMLASSIALSISDIPFNGPTGSVVVGRVDKHFVINPNAEQIEKSDMHVAVSGTAEAILMVEAGAHEVTETDMLAAIMFGHKEIKAQVEFIQTIVKKVGKTKLDIKPHKIDETLDHKVRSFATSYMEKALTETDLEKRRAAEDRVDALVKDQFVELYDENKQDIHSVLYNIKKEIVREKILVSGTRPDGRRTKDIRPIWTNVGVLPRVHGSAVFTRGSTQVLNICTLGMIADAQKIDDITEEEYKRYMHHYNMPPYATGEARPLRATGRREVGHGALAERALLPVLPSEDEFPYAIRTVSEVLSSNGSSSMASVCGSSMSLMNAGVPIKSAVAGIAMGLIKDSVTGKVAVLSDIQGMEDFLDDMDFKVAGTSKGITAIQMDIKIAGIDENIIKTALAQAQEGRMHILKKMEESIKKPNTQLSQYAPKIITFNINPDKIREVIGTGGKVINKIIDDCDGVKIDITDEGRVCVGGTDQAMLDKAKKIIDGICFEPTIGFESTGKVVRIIPIGAFVEFNGKEGMIHISKLSKTRVEKVEDVVKIGDEVHVKVIKIDEKNRIDLQRVEK